MDISATLGMQTTFKYSNMPATTLTPSKAEIQAAGRISGIAGTPPTQKNQGITKKLESEKIRNKGALQH